MLGHWRTWATIDPVLAPCGFVLGRWSGWKTLSKPFQHLRLWVHNSDFHTMVTYPLVYVCS